MTRDIETLTKLIQICLVIAAFCASSFPVLYAFFPWRSTMLGRLLMLQSISFAVALDLTLLFQFWFPKDILVIFWVNALVFLLIAVATAALTVMLWMTNHPKALNQRIYKRRKTDV